MSPNHKFDAPFGSDNGHENLQKRPDGMVPVIKWLNEARENPAWDLTEEK